MGGYNTVDAVVRDRRTKWVMKWLTSMLLKL